MKKPKPKTVLFIFGTRPEAIKMAPVIREFLNDSRYKVQICSTGQHRKMLDQVLAFFEICPDFDLHLMTSNQSLNELSARILSGCAEVLEKVRPDIIFVQGDTTTAFSAALAGFQSRIPVAHIEAGLRSYQRTSPFPEEMNRVLISRLADLHFPPLATAQENLIREGITSNVHVVGNTVVDALLLGLELIKRRGEMKIAKAFNKLRLDRKVVLVTIHRRESFGQPIVEVFEAIRQIASDSTIEVVYPVHLNPNVHKVAHRILGGQSNIHLIEPLDYAHFIWLMSKSSLIITDSGGVQEEAPSFGIPVLVARDVTERAEGIAAGCAKLVGTDGALIVREALSSLNSHKGAPQKMNPYGNGTASEQILKIVAEFFEHSPLGI